jgi:hypothetical protein
MATTSTGGGGSWAPAFPSTQRFVYMAVAVIIILAIGVKWPTAAAWLFGLILVGALLINVNAISAVINGG